MSSDLHQKVLEWLNGEGYPLEFRAAHYFRQADFGVRQGIYVRETPDATPREIAVSAQVDGSISGSWVRISHVVECAWTKNNPWVVLASEHTRMMPSAVIAQAIGNEVGRAALWCVAGDSRLTSSPLFSEPARAGFSGRQALTDGQDAFCAAIQSVVSNANASVASNWRSNVGIERELDYVEIVLPIVVIEGPLFEAYYDEQASAMAIKTAESARVYWHGSPSWRHRASVEIVTLDALPEFLKTRRVYTEVLLTVLMEAVSAFRTCNEKLSMKDLVVQRNSSASCCAGLTELRAAPMYSRSWTRSLPSENSLRASKR